MNIVGAIEFITPSHVSGYCFDSDCPHDPSWLNILINDQLLATIKADIERSELKEKGIGNGRCGFWYAFPAERNIDLDHVVIVPKNASKPLPLVHHKRRDIVQDKCLYPETIDHELARWAQRKTNLTLINHIPKTAGSSLRQSVQNSVGSRYCMFHYNAVLTCHKTIWDWKFSHKPVGSFEDVIEEILEKDIRVVMGHFGHPESYGFDRFAQVFPQAKTAAFFRNPFQHIYSLYMHARRNEGNPDSFPTYIEHQFTQNYQTQRLCGRTIEQFSAVGLVERYEHSIQIFGNLLGVPLAYEETNNFRSDPRVGYDLHQIFTVKLKERFEHLNGNDISLYHKASELFKLHLRSVQYP